MRFVCVKLRFCIFCFAVFCIGSSRDIVAQRTVEANLFDFHSGFWINLHHFLYREAQLSEPQKGSDNLALSKADSDELQQLSVAERKAWNEAVSYYGGSLVKRDLLFDDDLSHIKDQLEDAEASPNLANTEISEDLKAVLLKAAPIYRKHWWERHNAENQEWIAHVEPLVQRYGSVLSAKVSSIYDEPWPQYPVRVDAVAYANWAGAYTTTKPTRPTISTTDPSNQGSAALETLFHETSHGMMGNVREAINAAETNLNAHRPGVAFHSGSISHAVLFYTAGELVAEQIPGYTPYADKNGLWVRAWPAPDRSLIEQDWKPHMDGSVTLQQSLSKLVTDLAAATPNGQALAPAQDAKRNADHQHDFDWEIGEWNVHLRRLLHPLTASKTWVEFEGRAHVRKVWNGRANLLELELKGPTGHIEGLSLRLYNPESGRWSVYFATSDDGTLGTPMVGQFQNGRGEFFDQELLHGKTIDVHFVFSDVTEKSFHGEQSFSADGGKSWETNWIEDFSRATP